MTAPPCPHCHAPTPLAGDVSHAWDCPRSDAPKRFADWALTKPYVPDTTFTPLPPLATLSPAERARLVAAARVCEAAWAETRERRPKGAAA